MLKKVFAVVVIGGVAFSVLASTRIGSHVSAWSQRASERFDKQIAPEHEIRRIKLEAQNLDHDVDRLRGDLAEANVSVGMLRKELDGFRTGVKVHEQAVRTHGELLTKAVPTEQVAWEPGRMIDFSIAKSKLADDVRRQNDLRMQLKAKEKRLSVEESTRDLIERQLTQIQTEKETLLQAVREAEYELKIARLEEMRSTRAHDDTRLTDVKKSLAELNRKLKVQRERLRLEDATVSVPAGSEKTVAEILSDLNPKPTTDE